MFGTSVGWNGGRCQTMMRWLILEPVGDEEKISID